MSTDNCNNDSITHQLPVKHFVLSIELHFAQWSLIWHATTMRDPISLNYFKLCRDMKLMGWLDSRVRYIYFFFLQNFQELSRVFFFLLVVVVKWTCSPISLCFVICSKSVRRSMALCGIVLGKIWRFMHHASGMPTVKQIRYATF